MIERILGSQRMILQEGWGIIVIREFEIEFHFSFVDFQFVKKLMKKEKEKEIQIILNQIQFNSIQFNSIQLFKFKQN